MKTNIQLPFFTPTFATTQASAAPGLAMENHPTAYNQMLNQTMFPACTRRFINGITTPQASARVYVKDFSCLEKKLYKFEDILKHYEILFKEMLNEGFYIFYYGVDDFYLDGKSWFGTKHMTHNGVICGYDDEDMTYSIAAYDINWVFNLIKVPQKSFEKGLFYEIQNNRFGSALCYKVKDITVELDQKQIIDLMKLFLSKTIEKFPLDEQGDVTGIAVHDFLALYVEKLQNGSIPLERMDWRALRPIWEHKKCMYDRLYAVEKETKSEHLFSKEYLPLVEEANRLRMLYAICHKSQKTTFLNSIKNGLTELRKKEQDILSGFIENFDIK